MALRSTAPRIPRTGRGGRSALGATIVKPTLSLPAVAR